MNTPADNRSPNTRLQRGCMYSRMRGQALILALVTMAVLVLGVIVLFNTGQVLDKKVELVNAADATAYSVAVQQARAYNMIAYMNRASVANEVAIAQLVSWYSWTNFALSATDNLKSTATKLAGVAVLFGAVPVALALVDSVIVLSRVKTVLRTTRDTIMRPVFGGVANALELSNSFYSKSSEAIVLAVKPRVIARAKEVVKLNTSDKAHIGSVGLGLLLADATSAAGYTKRFKIPTTAGTRSADADRYANVVMEARDGFSRARSAKVLIVRKRGGTDLVDYRRWVGVDTLNAKAKTFIKKINLALAWGGGVAEVGSHPSFKNAARRGNDWISPYESSRGRHTRYDGGLENGRAGGKKKVQRNPAVGGEHFAWLPNLPSTPGVSLTAGLNDYNDTADNKATVPYLNGKSAADDGVKALDVGPVFTVLVEQPINTVRTSNQIKGLGGEGEFQAPDRAVGDTIAAMASAQVYFSRPRDLFASAVDSRREVGNLFSPYWQARLVETPCITRQEVAVFSGAVAPCIPGRG